MSFSFSCILRAPSRLLLSSFFCFAQVPSSLHAESPAAGRSASSLVEEALSRNPEITYYEAAIAQAKGERVESGKLANPEVTAQLARWSVGGAGAGPAWQAAASQTFEWPGRMALRKAIADRQTELAELGLAAFKQSLAAKVRRLAREIDQQTRIADAAADGAERIKGILAVQIQRDATGAAPLLEMRILESNALTLSRESAAARQSVASARVELNLLRAAPASSPLDIAAHDLTLSPLPALPALLKAADAHSYDIRTKQAELRQQGLKADLARNERGPAITVQPFLSSQKAGADHETTAGLSVTLPLPLWNKKEGSIAAADARKVQAETLLMVTVREVEKQVTILAQAAAAQSAEIAQWRPGAMEDFKSAAEQADRHYQLGAIPVSTYVEMQKSYLEALQALSAASAEAAATRLELEILTGLPLSSNPNSAAK